MEVKEIGIEKELFLIKNDKIMEPSLYGFPADEMGFLIEIRSLPSDRAYPVITTLFNEELQYQLRANKFGMNMIKSPYLYEDEEFVRHIENTYKIKEFPDYTKNIYGKKDTHHFGIFPENKSTSPITGKKMYKLTAGVHVHFSNRDSETGDVIDLPIVEIVSKMDALFCNDIERTGRIKGELEPKKHGFEYRSLPCDVDMIKVVKESFKILRSI